MKLTKPKPIDLTQDVEEINMAQIWQSYQFIKNLGGSDSLYLEDFHLNRQYTFFLLSSWNLPKQQPMNKRYKLKKKSVGKTQGDQVSLKVKTKV